MKMGLVAGVLGSVLVVGVVAARAATKYTCTLTGKTVEKCCCVQKDGQLYCTLANKTVDPCCCKPAEK